MSTICTRFRLPAAIALSLVASSPSHSQSRFQGKLEDGEIMVQSQRSMMLRPGSGIEIKAAQEDAVRMLYGMAQRECALILDTIGSACELVAISTNTSGNEDSASAQSIRATGSFSMRVMLKK